MLFDGGCALCAGSVRFILKRDPHEFFQFRSLQDPATRAWLAAHGVNNPPDSILLVEGDQLSFRSTAALRICRHLRAPWPLLGVFRLLPRFLRDALYDAVARRRYRWFGRVEDVCSLTDTLPPERVWDAALQLLRPGPPT